MLIGCVNVRKKTILLGIIVISSIKFYTLTPTKIGDLILVMEEKLVDK
jgi:hypothetical protein